MTAKLAAIVAMDEQGVIGKDNQLPWHLPADLAHFKRTTMSKAILMGRKTHQSIGKPLPGRRNIVLSRTLKSLPGCEVVSCWDDIAALKLETDLMVIGGAEIYAWAMPHIDELHVTRVHAQIEGDAWFSDWSQTAWQLLSEHHRPADEKNALACTFQHWRRQR